MPMGVISHLAATGTVLLMGLSCVGAGASVLAGLRLLSQWDRLEAVVWSFVVGLGVVGWTIFFFAWAGAIQTPVFAAIFAMMLPGLLFLSATKKKPRIDDGASPVIYLLHLVLACAIAVDLMEALSPPVDADSLAYHFALPKEFLDAGRLIFVPRAVDGAIPLLVQMTWMAALSLGGELGVTLWAATTGWWLGLVGYVIALPYIGRAWAMCVAIVILTTPVILYSAGTGQVEVRIALFATLAAMAVAHGVVNRSYGYAALAGLLVGFSAASKYSGLPYGVAAIIPFLIWWRAPKAILIFSAAAAVAGLQWYGWNWWHTGDPVFPVLHGLLNLPDNEFWSADMSRRFDDLVNQTERPLSRNLFWLFAYPIHATLWPISNIESGRTGFGPYWLVALPFAAAGLWQCRHKVLSHPMFVAALVAGIFYLIWFVIGASQRVRHLLPIWPIVVVCITIAAVAGWRHYKSLYRPFVMGSALCIMVQMAGQVIFGVSYWRHFTSGETRDEFLDRSVAYFGFIAPTEAAMSENDRVLTDRRQLIYIFNHSVFYYHVFNQNQVVPEKAQNDLKGFLDQMRRERITLLIIDDPIEGVSPSPHLARAVAWLEAAGCARNVKKISGIPLSSRTLGITSGQSASATLYRLTDKDCRL